MARRYARAPETGIDPSKHDEATIHTLQGDFTVELIGAW
jgi:hypothetical protein